MHQDSFRELGRHYQPGEIIYRQGDGATQFFVVQHGEVTITRTTSCGQTLLVEPGEGEVFGIVSLFTAGQTRFSTATAKTEARILSIDAKTFIVRLHQDPSTAFRIIRHLSQRIFDLDHTLPEFNRTNGRALQETRRSLVQPNGRKLLNVHDFSVGHHFLIVEDEVEFFMLMREWLQEADEQFDDLFQFPSHKLTLATTFHEAETLLGQDKYDLILLDLHLSDSHGYEETFLRIQERAFDTPIIVFTGLDDNRKAIRAVEEGAQDYLIKGQVNKKIFIHSLYHALSRHKLMKSPSLPTTPADKENDRKHLFTLFDWSVCAEHRQVTC
ncbi:MAG: cyclic nucleotide-binding domain-containing protein [Magnetococcales bacterium]|nr:cyclic nucleotide-binding domain-containing protein [Magnetococcales bacterium]